MKPTRAEVRDIATWTLIWAGHPDELLLHKTGTVSVPRYLRAPDGSSFRNGWHGYSGRQVLVLMWP